MKTEITEENIRKNLKDFFEEVSVKDSSIIEEKAVKKHDFRELKKEFNSSQLLKISFTVNNTICFWVEKDKDFIIDEDKNESEKIKKLHLLMEISIKMNANNFFDFRFKDLEIRINNNLFFQDLNYLTSYFFQLIFDDINYVQ